MSINKVLSVNPPVMPPDRPVNQAEWAKELLKTTNCSVSSDYDKQLNDVIIYNKIRNNQTSTNS